MKTSLTTLAEAVLYQLREQRAIPFADCWVYRLGAGTEHNNREAIRSYLEVLMDNGVAIDCFNDARTGDVSSVRTVDSAVEIADRILLRLQDQTLDLWSLIIPRPLEPCDFIQPSRLSLPQCFPLAHALIDLFSAGRPTQAFESQCESQLVGAGDATQRIAQWIHLQEHEYVYNPSELLMPLARHLLFEIFPDYSDECG